MRSARVAMLVLAVLGVSARLTTGCASSEEANGPATDGGDGDSDVGAIAAPDSSFADGGDGATRKTCSPDGWCHTALPLEAIVDASDIDPATASIGLRDVWVTADREAWAVAQQGYVLRWRAGAWTLVTDTRRPLRSVWASSADDVWMAGDQGLLHGTMKDGTFTVEEVRLDTTEPVLRIRGTSPSDLWAVTRTAIYRKAGSSFTRLAFPNGIVDPTASQQIADVWVRGRETWIGGQEFTSCSPEEDPNCHYEARMVLLRWKGDSADAGPDASPLALWERIVIPYVPSEQIAFILNASLSPDGTHFINFLGWSSSSAVGRIATGGEGIADASPLGDGGPYGWSLAPAAPVGTMPEGIWAASSKKAWLIASPGIVRQWDGESWKLARISITTSPLAKVLHGIGGIVDGDGESDVWIVGDDIAMHRSETP